MVRPYKKKTKRAKLRLKLDDLWAEIIKDRGSCEYCFGTQNLNAHHHYGKRALSTRWEFDNGVCLCPNHHTFSSIFSAHQTPADFVKWIEDKRGQNWADRLRKKHNKIVKFTDEDLLEKIKDLEDLLIKIKELRNETN